MPGQHTRTCRVDENQPEIVRHFRRLGASVQTLHTVGGGCPDLLIGYRGKNGVVEIKNPNQPPSKRCLTKGEAEWHDGWRGSVVVIETEQDVESYLDRLKYNVLSQPSFA